MGEGALTSAAARRHIIKRPRLTRLLDETTARIILLVAPAGYGKTTLAREWLEDKPHVWYQVQAPSADPAALASGLVGGATASRFSVGPDVGLALAAGKPPEPSALADLVLSDLAELPLDVVIAMDDVHLLEGSASDALLQHLSNRVRLRLLITSRLRPAWATARRILYGEVQELGRYALALNHDEGRRILRDRGSTEVAGLMALSDGWPAVIGLAAHMRDLQTTKSHLPSALHDYFAEELFQAASPRIRRALCQLSIPPRPDLELVDALFGDEANSVLDAGRDLGFLTPETDGRLSLHPLLRAFLERKLVDLEHGQARHVAESCVRYYIEIRDWDAAYSIVKDHRLIDVLPTLLVEACDELLQSGRIDTLAEWTSSGDDSAELQLARAEVSFRKAVYLPAETAAKKAALTLRAGHPWRSRAWFRAGQAAYFRDDLDRALDYFSEARDTARTPAEVKAALWGAFHATVDDEPERARETLRHIAELAGDDEYDELRYVNGLVALAVRVGPIDKTVLPVEAALGLLDTIDDPVARTGLMHSATHVFLLTGQFRRARAVAAAELQEARRYSLDFVIPHAITRKTMAEVALGDFKAARATLESYTAAHEDAYSRVIIGGAKLRLVIASQSDELIEILPDYLTAKPSRSTRAEYLATLALWYACKGETHAAIASLRRCKGLSVSFEPRVFSASAAAVLQLHCGRRHSRSVERLARLALASDCWEPLVCAVRGYRPLLTALLETGASMRHALERLTIETGDPSFARVLGMRLDRGSACLTPREREVHALLGEGLTNKEIAHRLVIAESTAKVHVRRVMEKLGAQTRTAAALRFAREI